MNSNSHNDVHEVPVPRHRLEARNDGRALKCPRMLRRKMTISMIVPQRHVKPWKPVSMKNVAP
jgi:hypothetical protein